LENVDQIIRARWILPVNPRDTVLEHHAVALRDGRIVAIVPGDRIAGAFHAPLETALDDHLLMPGLVNTHGHAAMTLLRGLADDHTLMDWLQDHIWPAEARWMGEDFVRTGTRLAIAEMLASGTTCASDMYFFPDVAAAAVVEAGFRAQIAFPILEHASAWGANADEYLAKGLQVRDDYRSCPRLSFAFGPHAPYTTSDQTLARVAMLAAELDSAVQMHVHETAGEVHEAIAHHGCRPLARLEGLGLLSPRFQAVHMTQVAPEDLELLVRNQVQVLHCPSSNLKLAAGFCPVRTLGAAGINVALGTGRGRQQQRARPLRRDAPGGAAGQGQQRRSDGAVGARGRAHGHAGWRRGTRPGRAHRQPGARQGRRHDRRRHAPDRLCARI
jgi:5-methylthioadenosine/S-adenosylhomocysteine deaminase